MLKELQVKNFAIIDDVKINFRNGLNILSGETGAGKTLIIEALNLLIGERAENALIRDNEEKLMVQGYFDFSGNPMISDFLKSENLIDDNGTAGEVVISREVNRNAKNRAFINGIFTQVGTLKRLGKFFVDIHSQNDHQYLLEPRAHIEIIDNFGKNKISNAKNAYREYLAEFLAKKEKLNRLEELQDKREERLTELNFKLDEIDKLDIKEDEEKNLENEHRILKNYEKIFQLASEAKKTINSDEAGRDSLSDDVAVLNKNVAELAGIDHEFKRFENKISDLGDFIEELSHFLNSYLSEFEFSADRLNSIQERLYRLSEIKKKYNMDLSRIKEHSKKIKEEIDNLEDLENEIGIAKEQFKEANSKTSSGALELSKLRQEAVSGLKEKVTIEMENLGFKSVLFDPHHNYIEDENGIEIGDKRLKFSSDGIDNIEFFISVNIGENARPLRKVASGGEISRIMLALKSIISSAYDISTMVFDEIDAGIGGATSLVVGEKLFKISMDCQVLVITHLAQIACFSDFHYFIDKYIEDGRTKIKITKMEADTRVKEISRMISGESISNISLMHAEKLLEKCKNIKDALLEEKIKVGN